MTQMKHARNIWRRENHGEPTFLPNLALLLPSVVGGEEPGLSPPLIPALLQAGSVLGRETGLDILPVDTL